MNPARIFRIFTIAAFALPLALTINAQAQDVPTAITTDPPRDKDFPATTEAPDIISHNTRLNSVFYLASGAGPHPVVLLLHAIEDTQASIAFLRSAAKDKKYRTDPAKIAIVGHSMGGFLGLYATAHDPAILGMIAISPWNLGAAAARPDSEARTKSYHDASPRLAGTTPEGMLNEAKQNSTKWNYVDWANDLKSRPIFVIESADGNVPDNHALFETLQKAGDTRATEIHMETDHVYSDHRIALQAAVLSWLQNLKQ
jgi:acetyl esterase/lipase